MYRVRYRIDGDPFISIVLPLVPNRADGDVRRACQRTLAMLAERTSYRRFEVVMPVTRSGAVDSRCRSRDSSPLEVSIEEPTFHRRLGQQKLAAAHATGTHLLFLEWGLQATDSEWLAALLEYSQHSPIGAVGGKLHNADGSLKHIGVVLGINGVAAPAFHLHPRSSLGYWGTAIAVRNYSAVSGECLMTRRDVYEEVGGFDDDMGEFGDLDYCLRLRQVGYRVVFTPHAALIASPSSISAADADPNDALKFRLRWSDILANDPYYNPNLSRDTPDYEPHLRGREEPITTPYAE